MQALAQYMALVVRRTMLEAVPDVRFYPRPRASRPHACMPSCRDSGIRGHTPGRPTASCAGEAPQAPLCTLSASLPHSPLNHPHRHAAMMTRRFRCGLACHQPP
jgi:hypothetical protein